MPFKIEKHKEITQVQSLQDTRLGIVKWGEDNSFPQTFKNLVTQSPVARPTVERTARFYQGGKFEYEEMIINSYGQTLKDLVKIAADDYAHFKAFALHCNYNVLGQVTGVAPLRIAELRFNELDDLNYASKIGYHRDFGKNAVYKRQFSHTVNEEDIKWIDRFNPDPEIVMQQIEEARSIGNYQGQVLYYSDEGFSSYPIPPLQAPINFVLSDIENSILVRKESATGFINSYLLKTAMQPTDANLITLENAINEAQGARGSGKIITMSGMDPEELGSTVLEAIGGGGRGAKSVIESSTAAYDLAARVIHAAYLIPPILAGDDQKTGFSSPDLIDAYDVFNAITQDGRETISQSLTQVFKDSVFPIDEVNLTPLTLILSEEKVEENNGLNEGAGAKEELEEAAKTDYNKDKASSHEVNTGFKNNGFWKKWVKLFKQGGE